MCPVTTDSIEFRILTDYDYIPKLNSVLKLIPFSTLPSPFPLHSQTCAAAWRRSHRRDGPGGSWRRGGSLPRWCCFGATTRGAPATTVIENVSRHLAVIRES